MATELAPGTSFADVYSLGCVLFECLAGVRPYDRDSELSVVFAHLNEPPPKLTDVQPELPAAFDEVFATALAKSPDDRYSSCGELASAAHAALRGKVLPRRRRRRWLLAATVALLVVAAAAAAGLLLTGGSKAAPVTITPTSIGGAKLGDTDVTLERLWGNGYRKSLLDFPENYSLLTVGGRALSAYFAGTSDRTVEITTAASGDRTADGIGPCSTLAELKKAYGARLKPNPHMRHGKLIFSYTLGKHLLGDDAGRVRSAAAYARWLLANPGLEVTGPKPVSVGGLSGYVLDLRVRKGYTRTCPWSQGRPVVQVLHGVAPTNPDQIEALNAQPYVMRLYLLDYKGATLGIEINEVTGSDKLDDYSAIVKTFRFSAG